MWHAISGVVCGITGNKQNMHETAHVTEVTKRPGLGGIKVLSFVPWAEALFAHPASFLISAFSLTDRPCFCCGMSVSASQLNHLCSGVEELGIPVEMLPNYAISQVQLSIRSPHHSYCLRWYPCHIGIGLLSVNIPGRHEADTKPIMCKRRKHCSPCPSLYQGKHGKLQWSVEFFDCTCSYSIKYSKHRYEKPCTTSKL